MARTTDADADPRDFDLNIERVLTSMSRRSPRRLTRTSRRTRPVARARVGPGAPVEHLTQNENAEKLKHP